ncbi:unnamed protein product, partial [Schistosoma curassoni]
MYITSSLNISYGKEVLTYTCYSQWSIGRRPIFSNPLCPGSSFLVLSNSCAFLSCLSLSLGVMYSLVFHFSFGLEDS